MFNVGSGELLIILFVALVVLGPDKLPDAARKIGNVMGEIKRMSAGFQDEVRSAIDTPARIVNETVTQTSAPTSDAPVTDPGSEVTAHLEAGATEGTDESTEPVDATEGPVDAAPDDAAPDDAAPDATIVESTVEPTAIEVPTTEAPAVFDSPDDDAPTVEAPIVNVPIDHDDAAAPRHADDDAAAFAGNPRHGLAP
ncbi:MAG: twin-arginine translocase TatA/TatE family subunit [Acidimicrobiales bacterium]